MSTTQEEIKILLLKNGMSITKMAKKMSELTPKAISRNTLSTKLINDTLRYSEYKLILEILGYENQAVKKTTRES